MKVIYISLLILALVCAIGQANGEIKKSIPLPEYDKQVNASEILEKIKRGETVNYPNANITGDLNLNQLKLDSVHINNNRTDLSSSVNINNSLINGNIDFSNVHFKSKINITDCIIMGDANFSNSQFSDSNFLASQFRQKANFSKAQFDQSANFSEVQFNQLANFSKVQFDQFADFLGAEFNQSADFSAAKFDQGARFWWAQFNQDAIFNRTEFKKDAIFNGARFNQSAGFERSKFLKNSRFWRALFNGPANFKFAEFNSKTDFASVIFNNIAEFSEAKFIGPSAFSNKTFNDTTPSNWRDKAKRYSDAAKFKDSANFWNASFNSIANFSSTSFDDTADFGRSNFTNAPLFSNSQFKKECYFDFSKNVSVDFEYARFSEPLYLEGSTIKKLNLRNARIKEIVLSSWNTHMEMEFDEMAYLLLLTNFRNRNLPEDANECYYDYRDARRSNSQWLKVNWYYQPVDYGLMLFYGYGVKPERPVIWAFVFMAFFALIFWWRQGIMPVREGEPEAEAARFTFPEAIAFSGMTFLSGGKLVFDPPEYRIAPGRPWRDVQICKALFVWERLMGMILIVMFAIAVSKTIILGS